MFHLIIVLTFKYVHDNQRTLLLPVAKVLLFAWQIRKDDEIETIVAFSKFDQWLAVNVTWKSVCKPG